jgi:hypothetical protein
LPGPRKTRWRRRDPAFDPRKFYLSQTRDAQQAVEKARQVQVAAVEAFAAYAVAKVGKDPAATLQEKQAAVIAYLAQFPTLLSAVRGLMGKSPAGAVRLPEDLEIPGAALSAIVALTGFMPPSFQLLLIPGGVPTLTRHYLIPCRVASCSNKVRNRFKTSSGPPCSCRGRVDKPELVTIQMCRTQQSTLNTA